MCPVYHLYSESAHMFFRQLNSMENPMDGGAWWATVHGVTKSRTRLSDFTFTLHFHALEKEMATHSSVLALRILGTGKPGWAAVYGVAQSWTRLTWLSSSSEYKVPGLVPSTGQTLKKTTVITVSLSSSLSQLLLFEMLYLKVPLKCQLKNKCYALYVFCSCANLNHKCIEH